MAKNSNKAGKDKAKGGAGTREEILREVRSWRAYAISRIKRGKSLREYRSNILDKNFIELVQSYLSRASTLKDVVTVFDVVLAELEA